MARKARAARRKPVCRCECNYEVSTVQDTEYHTHRIVLICEDCGRVYGLEEAFASNLSPRIVADLIVKATEPR